MSSSKPKAFTWRLSNIPSGCAKEQIPGLFVPEDRDRIRVLSLCPDADAEGYKIATVLFQPKSDRTKEEARLDSYHAPGVTIDKTFYDFTPLYYPPNGIVTADIIAVTGLAGHAFGSWAHADDKMWLRDYLPELAPSARILTYGYNNPISGDTTSCSTITDLSEAFRSSLISMRDAAKCEKRPIIFIGHSLGGLIIKKALTDDWCRNANPSRLPVRSILFLGVPHNGMYIEPLQILIGDTPPKALLSELQAGSETLKHLNRDFKKMAYDVSIYTVWESMTTKTVVLDPSTNQLSRLGTGTIMVPEHSARLDLPREKVAKADADHSTIAKVNKSQKNVWRGLSLIMLAAMGGSLAEKPQQMQQEQQPSGQLVHNATNIPATTPDRTPSPSTAPWNSETGLMGSPNPSETHTYQQRNGSPGGSPGHQFISSLPFRPAPATTVTSPSHLSADYFNQRSTTPQPLPSGVGQSSYPYRSSSGGGGSSSHTSIQGMSRSGGSNTAASSTIIGSKQMGISSDIAPSNKEPPGCHCNLVEVFCAMCRAAIHAMDYFWVCDACQIGSRVCTACHARWSKSRQCVLHSGWNATISIFPACETRVQWLLELEMPIEDILAIRALKPNDFANVVARYDEEGFGALHIASRWHLTDAVEVLLRCRGVQINEQDNNIFTPLAYAIESASACIVQRLLEFGADIDIPVGRDGDTPLHMACRLGFESIVRLLTSEYHTRGLTSIDKMNNAGKTALFDACAGKHWEAATILLRAGADPLAEALAAGSGNDDPTNQIGMLAVEGHTEAVSFLLNERGDLSAECADSHSRTLLWFASANGHANLCETLIRMGASPNGGQRDPLPQVLYYHLDSTPLYHAALGGFLSICKMLVEAGADMTLKFTILGYGSKTFHWGALEAAASNGHKDVVSYLLLQGAVAWPPAECDGKWKNFLFQNGVSESKKKVILQLLRAYKHS